MAEGSVTPAYVATLTEALARRLPGAEIDHEHVRDRRYRFMVVTPTFDGMGHPERQRIVWDEAGTALARADVRDVAMIITMAPAELATAE